MYLLWPHTHLQRRELPDATAPILVAYSPAAPLLVPPQKPIWPLYFADRLSDDDFKREPFCDQDRDFHRREPKNKANVFHVDGLRPTSEDDVLVVLITQQVFAFGSVFCLGAVLGLLCLCLLCLQPGSFLDCCISLFLARDLF